MNQAADILLHHRDTQRVIYRTRQDSYTVADVQNHAYRTVHALLDLGVRPGDTVILRAPDSMQWIYVFWALVIIGAPIMIVLDNIDDTQWQHVLTQYHSDWVITDRVLDVKGRIGIDIGNLDHSNSDPVQPYRYTKDQAMFYWASSGTNGGFKFIAHTNESFIGTVAGLEQYWLMVQGRAGDTMFCPSRMAFSMGCCFNVLGPLVLPYLALVGRSFLDLRDIHAFVRSQGIDHIMMTPYVLDFVERRSQPGSLAPLRSVTSSAESLPLSLAARFQAKFHIPVFNLYGSSELLIVAMSTELSQENSVGRVLPHIQVRLVNDEGTVLDQGQTGIIQVRSPSQFQEYVNDADTTAKALRDGWVHTNDMGYFDAQGNLILLGRANACVKVRGQWVSLAVIENQMLQCADIQDCVVVQTPNHRGLLELMALVVTDRPESQILPLFDKMIRSVVTSTRRVEEIPRTVNMKKIRDFRTIQDRLNTVLA